MKRARDIDQTFYNPYNKLVTKEYIEGVLEKIVGTKLKIHNLYLYQVAFIHKSVYKKNIAPPPTTSKESIEPLIFYHTYESLEFVGDAWLGAIAADYLYHRYPGQNEGFLTKLRTKIVCSKNLAKFAEYLGMYEYLLLSPRIEQSVGRHYQTFLEDIFEAFCGAIKLDLGIQVLTVFLKNLIEATVHFNNIILFDDDYKSTLLQYFQKNGWNHPTYTTISQSGASHQRCYNMGVDYLESHADHNLPYIETNIDLSLKDNRNKRNPYKLLAMGNANTKKEAEQLASKEGLKIFGILIENENEENSEIF